MTSALAVAVGLVTMTGYTPAHAAVTKLPADCASKAPTGNTHDRLKVKAKPQDPKIIDPTTKKPIILRGYNWGEWDTAQFPKDPNENVAQGANSVRIPLRWWGDYKTPGVDSYDRNAAATGYIEPCHLKLLDETIKQAVDKHLWVILFVDSDNGQGSGKDPAANFWNRKYQEQRDQFKDLWRFLTKRYQNTPYIGALEILPEPNLNTSGKDSPTLQDDQDVKSFYEEFIKVIRGTDHDTPIVVGPNDLYNIKRLDHVVTTADDNIIYTGDYFIHDEPLDRTKALIDFQYAHSAPVWINQVGIESGKPGATDAAKSVLNDLNIKGIGWSWWTYRVRAASKDTHGIYYADPSSESGWKRKQDWYELVGNYLPRD